MNKTTKEILDGAMPDWESEEEDFILGDAGTVVGYRGNGGEVIIPEYIAGKLVTSIRDFAFVGCSRLTSIMIRAGTTNIGKGAFSDCTCLEAITVDAQNSSYSHVEGVLFNKDQTILIQYPAGKASNDYTIPHSVKRIADGAFTGCTLLTSINMLDSVTSVGKHAFANCTGLISVALTNSVTKLGYGVFSRCTRLTDVRIGNSVTSLGRSAFYKCKSLTSISIPKSVTSIGKRAFAGCTGLTGIYFRGTAPTSLGADVFIGDNEVTVYYLPGTTGYGAEFGGRPALPGDKDVPCACAINNNKITIAKYTGSGGEVIIPSTINGLPVTSIGHRAFYKCRSLISIALPNSITTIEDGAFNYCDSLTAITVDPLNPVFSDVDGVLFNRDQTKPFQYPAGKAEDNCTIHKSVTSIRAAGGGTGAQKSSNHG